MTLSDHGALHVEKRATCKYSEWTRLKDTCEFHRTLKNGTDTGICNNDNILKCESCTDGPWSAWAREDSVRNCMSRRWRKVFTQENGTKVTCSEENEDSYCNDCELGEWSSWDTGRNKTMPCYEQRMRPILKQATRGGHECGLTDDSRACDGGLSAPSIAGIVIGSAIVLIALLVFICCCLKSVWRKQNKSGDTSKADSTSKSNSNSSAAKRRKKSDPERRKSIPKPPKPVRHPDDTDCYYSNPEAKQETRESKRMRISETENERYAKVDDPGAECVYHEIYKLDCDVGYETGSEFNTSPLEVVILTDNGYSEATYLEPNDKRASKRNSNVEYASPERKNIRGRLSNSNRSLETHNSHDGSTIYHVSENDSNLANYSTPQTDTYMYDVLERPRVPESTSSSGTSSYHPGSPAAQAMKTGSNIPNYSTVEINGYHVLKKDNDDYVMEDGAISGPTTYIQTTANIEEIPSEVTSHDYHVLECDNSSVDSMSDPRILNSNNNNSGDSYHLMKMDKWRDSDDLTRVGDNDSSRSMEETSPKRASKSRYHVLELPVLKEIRSENLDPGVHKVNSISRSTKL